MAPASLVELGAGSARKTRILLAAMEHGTQERIYAPVDVAGDFLRATAEALRVEEPSLDVRPQVRDITRGLDFVGDLPGPVLFALLGSTMCAVGAFAVPPSPANPLRPHGPNAKPARSSLRFPNKSGLRPGTPDAFV